MRCFLKKKFQRSFIILIRNNNFFLFASICSYFLVRYISDGKREVDYSYHLGFGIYVACAAPYSNGSIRVWKTANGRRDLI